MKMRNFTDMGMMNDSNKGDGTYENHDDHVSPIVYGLLPVKIVVVLATLILNLLVLIAIVRLRTKAYSNFLFASMALADFSIGSISIPFMTLFSTLDYWPLGSVPCVFWIINDFSSTSISLMSLFLISIHRYLQVKSPLIKHDRLTRPRCLQIAVLWAGCFTIWTTLIMLISRDNLIPIACAIPYTLVFVLIVDLIIFLLPIIGIVFFAFLAFYTLKRRVKSFGNLPLAFH